MKYTIGVLVLLILVIGVWLMFADNNSKQMSVDVPREKVTIYKSPTCGCCGNYVSYMKKLSHFDVDVVDVDDMDVIKKEHGVPSEMGSCHTTLVGNYVVEGHVPFEAVDMLLEQKPDISGIALPGMPSGSPGMPGPKTGSFIIHSLPRDGGEMAIFTTI